RPTRARSPAPTTTSAQLDGVQATEVARIDLRRDQIGDALLDRRQARFERRQLVERERDRVPRDRARRRRRLPLRLLEKRVRRRERRVVSTPRLAGKARLILDGPRFRDVL